MAINSIHDSEMTGNTDASKPPTKRWAYVIPVAVVMYMLAYLDRTNTAMILPYINSDASSQIHLTKADEGIVSGIFFFGYMFLQIPAAILAERWSAKKTVAILMFLWGFAAMAVSFVQSNGQFYTARFILGFFEGGVWPSVLILIANWFPLKERARANSLWMCCLPLSSVLISPITGILLDHFSWRTVLFVEGVPPLIWAIVWLLVVSNHPRDATWADGAEREYIEAELAADEASKPVIDSDGKGGYLAAARSPHVWQLIVIYLCFMGGFYGYTLWLPTVVKGLVSGSSASSVGLITAIPYIFAVVGMLAVSSWSDRTGDRRMAIAVPLFIGAVALTIGQLVHNPIVNIVLLVIVAIGVYSPYGPYWAVPGAYLRIEVLAGGLGLINALGNLGGFLGPYLVGWLADLTGSAATGYYALAGLLVAGAVLTWVVIKPEITPTAP
ncbi:MFS transporter [Cutibacterium modestum]|uniref:MFS transporter n=1 Tax=Cutibacterium modestum TaxID=2559073 RepID=UPI0020A33A3A|nr:MFS transporter [Cutibacterium modestum]MCP2379227.1 putative sugar transporter [Cutibacterium modestum 31N]